jgi:uncharacterized protein
MLCPTYLRLHHTRNRRIEWADQEKISFSSMAALLVTIVATSFLSGIFGMAGGMILMGVLLAALPLPDAMALHAIAQMASNGWRGLLWMKHVRWRAVTFYMLGCALALFLWSALAVVPTRPVALLALGLSPFPVRLMPRSNRPDPDRPSHGAICGALCMSLLLLTGVAGPLIDAYFLGGRLDRRQIVATKAACQIFGHGAKLFYFGGVIAATASVAPLPAACAVLAALLGTVLARPVLERLSEAQYRLWANRIVLAVAGADLVHGSYLLVLSPSQAGAP